MSNYYYAHPGWSQVGYGMVAKRGKWDAPPPLMVPMEPPEPEEMPKVLENSWPMFVNKYQRTFSFCKWCNDRIFEYRSKLSYDSEMKCYMIQLPCCRKCALANIAIGKLHHESFGNKKKEE
jgi:hypothetical protein